MGTHRVPRPASRRPADNRQRACAASPDLRAQHPELYCICERSLPVVVSHQGPAAKLDGTGHVQYVESARTELGV